jgi:hypothetical protein
MLLRTDYYHVHVYYTLDKFDLASTLRDKFIREVPENYGGGFSAKKASRTTPDSDV